VKYKIGYVDEDESDISRFYHKFIKKYDERYQIIEFTPKPSLDELIEEIINSDLDVLVVDFQLNEYKNLGYKGHSVVERIKELRFGFPCVLLTSYPVDAIENSLDTYIVYDKDVAFGNEEKSKDLFELQIKQSIEHYKKGLKSAEEEFARLSRLDDLTLKQEERLIELDDILESSIDNKHKLPSHLKKSKHIKNVESLVKDTQSLISELKKLNSEK
tara:strand:+ start:16233 stop:16880 length:648 start_codon:yes stop_codon:yes gene_type:complete